MNLVLVQDVIINFDYVITIRRFIPAQVRQHRFNDERALEAYEIEIGLNVASGDRNDFGPNYLTFLYTKIQAWNQDWQHILGLVQQ